MKTLEVVRSMKWGNLTLRLEIMDIQLFSNLAQVLALLITKGTSELMDLKCSHFFSLGFETRKPFLSFILVIAGYV